MADEKALVPLENEAHNPASVGDTVQVLYTYAGGDLNDAFSALQVSAFPGLPLGRVVEIPSSASVAEAMMTLSRHNILSAPIRDQTAPPDASWTDSYLGMVDFAGIVLWVLDQAQLAADVIVAGAAGAGGLAAGAAGVLGAAALGSTGIGAAVGVLAGAAATAGAAGWAVATVGAGGVPEKAVNETMDEEFYKAIKETDVFAETKVSEIKGTFRWGPFLPIQPSDSFLTLLLLVSKYRMKAVPMIEPGEGRIRNLITQSAVIRFLADCAELEWFKRVGDKTLAEAGLPLAPPEKVLHVTEGDKVLAAFQRMKEGGVGGVPVLDKEGGVVVGNVSARDIRFLLRGPGHFARRKEMTVREFMDSAASTPPGAGGGGGVEELVTPIMTPPITCHPGATIADVIALLAKTRIHRVYVTTPGGQLAGVVTLRDLISRFVSEPEGYFNGFFDKVVPGPSTSFA